MKFLALAFLTVWFLLDFHVLARDSQEMIANAVNSIADYFSTDCVQFLISLSDRADISNQRMAKILSLNFGKSFAFLNLSAYQNLLERTKKEPCDAPIRVIFESGTATAKNFREFSSVYDSYSDEINSGAWLIFTKKFEDKFTSKFFREIFLPVDTEIIVAWVHNDMIHFKEVYQVAPFHAVRESYLGNYTLKRGLLSERRFYFSRTNLEGLQLKVAYIEENVPYSTKTRHGYLGGYFGEIWTTLEDLLNISSTYVKVDCNRGEYEDKNSWLRMIQMLKEKNVDIGIGDFVQTSKRADQLDFSYPLLVSNFQVYYSNALQDRHFHGYLIPFGIDIWFAVAFWTVVKPLCISCFSLIRERFLRKSRNVMGMSTSLFLTFGGLCGQGVLHFPGCLSCKMLFLCTFVLAMIVIPSYSASLTRHLTTKSVEFIINDLNDFYRKGSHKIIVVDASYEYYFLKFTSSEELKKINEKYLAHEIHPKSYREALWLTCNRKNIAVFAVSSTLNWELNKAENAHLKEECDIRKMTQNMGTLVYSILYPKKSRYRKLIDYHLKNLQKTGIIGRLQQKYWMSDLNLRKKRWKSISLKNSISGFQIILYGAISSLLLLVLEQLLMSRTRKKTERKTSPTSCIF